MRSWTLCQLVVGTDTVPFITQEIAYSNQYTTVTHSLLQLFAPQRATKKKRRKA